VVVILNYVASKLLIFRKNREEPAEPERTDSEKKE